MAGHLEVTVCCNCSDPGIEGFCGLLPELDGWMEDRYCQGFDSGHHQVLVDQGVLPALIEGQYLDIK